MVYSLCRCTALCDNSLPATANEPSLLCTVLSAVLLRGATKLSVAQLKSPVALSIQISSVTEAEDIQVFHIFPHRHLSAAQSKQHRSWREFAFSCYSPTHHCVNTVLQNRECCWCPLTSHLVTYCRDLFSPGLYHSNVRPFRSNSQHDSYFSNKVFLQIKSTLANVVTSVDEECNISFTVCEHPT